MHNKNINTSKFKYITLTKNYPTSDVTKSKYM